MFVEYSVLSVEIKAESAKNKSQHLVMYPDSTGFVYFSEDGVDPDWMIPSNRENLQPVSQLFIGDGGKLSGKDLTRKQYVNKFITLLESKQYRLKFDALVSGKFLPTSFIEGAMNTFASRCDVMSLQVKEARVRGMSDEMIAASLKISEDDDIYPFVFPSNGKIQASIAASANAASQTIDASAVRLPDEAPSTNVPIINEATVLGLTTPTEFTDNLMIATEADIKAALKELGVSIRGKSNKKTLSDKLIAYHQSQVSSESTSVEFETANF